MKQLFSVVNFFALTFMAALALEASLASAQPPASVVPIGDESASFEVETILSDLDNPCGLTVRPTRTTSGPYDLFLAESGAGRILQLSTAKPDEFREVIVGFRTNPFNDHLPYRVGPLGLAFLTRSKLMVGDSGNPSGSDLLSVYILPSDGKAVQASGPDHSVGPLRNREGTDSGSINFLAMAKTDELVYLSVGGDDDQGVLLKAGINSNRLDYLQPLLIEDASRRPAARGGIAFIPPPQPPYLVVAEIGSYETPSDSSLVFYIPATGEMAMSLPTGLHDMMSLAYSPSGQLYATDFAWSDAPSGGVYRLDDVRIAGAQGCRAVRIASIPHPMSLTFTSDGVLYVTAFGNGENEKQGMLLKITGEL